MLERTRQLRINVNLSLLVLFITLALIVDLKSQAVLADGPTDEPVPEFDYSDRAKVVIVRVNFNGREDVKGDSVKIVYGLPPVRIGNPPLLRVRLFDAEGRLIEEFNEWHPLWLAVYADATDSISVLPQASGRFIFPLSVDLSEMELIDVPLQRSLIRIDLRPAIVQFCASSLFDPDCLLIVGIRPAPRPTSPFVLSTPDFAFPIPTPTYTPIQTPTPIPTSTPIPLLSQIF